MERKLLSVCMALLLVSGWVVSGCTRWNAEGEYQPRRVPAVSSTQLSATEIVPTLDTPFAKSGNAVWCATFQAAWNRVRDDLIREPVQLSNAEAVTVRLNTSPVTEAVLPSGSYYATAGRIQDGIAAEIRREMARRFPEAQVPTFPGGGGIIAYAYLDTETIFTTPFEDTTDPIAFKVAVGDSHHVRGFGLHESTDWDLREKQAEQVTVLFTREDQKSPVSRGGLMPGVHPNPGAFVLDLTADQTDRQLLIAVMPRPEHFDAALDYLAQQIEEFPPEDCPEGLAMQLTQLQDTDILAIPNVAFDVEHEFAELQGQIVENGGQFQGLPVVSACQKIRFRLDKSGAALASESDFAVAAVPRNFTVDRPFLIVMKERTAEQPYFMAWVENPELLEPEQAQQWFVSPTAIRPAIVAAIAFGLNLYRRRKPAGKARAAIFAGVLPLWIWLEAVVLVTVFGVPSDPASKLLAATFGLIWLCFGFIVGCSWPVILRMIPLLLWGIMVVWASLSVDRPYFITGAGAYALVSVMAGAWSWRCLPVGRTRMLASFCTGHLIGSLAGTFGTIIGAIFGTVIGVYMMPPDTTASRETSDGRQAGIDGK